ncbi:hypothetical protein FHS68_004969 [Dyadobacter arcticus]|uniref:Uncharacterized protein n=1 Tax=Dyadobacter arcticus TaxID=1078754 RepID=A0ABX0UXX9_9BACT|nr:hypothetical protein [Dyadobacter arcticus]
MQPGKSRVATVCKLQKFTGLSREITFSFNKTIFLFDS